MSDVLEAAKQFLAESGVPLPKIPEALAARLEQQGKGLFSTREETVDPYVLPPYVEEFVQGTAEDYVLICHSGHGINSYAVQYYLVYAGLGLFIHIGLGGVYMDNEVQTREIRESFALADRLVALVEQSIKIGPEHRLTVVAADFYDSYWISPGTESTERERKRGALHRKPEEVLTEALEWLGS